MRKFKNYRAIISQFIAVVMNKTDKIREGQIQIGDKHNYRPLSQPMVKETHSKVLRLITDLHHENHIDALLKHNNKEEKNILPFVTQYQPSVSTLKEVLLKKWNLTQNQPLLRQIFKVPRRKENP